MPTVSVIIPTYGHRDYVLQALESVFAQTFTDFEVIVVNDGSLDDTSELLRPLAERGSIRYVEQPNAGQAAARNRGLADANGEFIAFLDDDDLWPEDKLHWQVAALRSRDDLDVVGGSLKLIDAVGASVAGGGYTGDLAQEFTFSDLFDSNPFYSPGQTLIRRRALTQVGGLDPTIWGADDWDLWFRIAKCGRIQRVPRPSLLYRLHARNASRQRRRMYSATRRVLSKQLRSLDSSSRPAHRARGLNFIYSYAVKRPLAELRHSARLGHLSALPRIGVLLVETIPLLLERPQLLRCMINDLLPRELRRAP